MPMIMHTLLQHSVIPLLKMKIKDCVTLIMSYNNSKKTPPVALGYANKPASGCVFLMQKHVYIRANEGIKEAIEILFDFNTLY